MMDNIVLATSTMRTSVSSLKKKLSNIRIQVEAFDAELEKIDSKFDNLLTQAEIYKSKLEREMGREVRRLERELALLRKNVKIPAQSVGATETELKIASTIAIFNGVLRLMCGHDDDFQLASEAFLFPAIYERVATGLDEAYFLTEVPASAALLIERGKQHVEWIRQEYDTHLTYPDTWRDAIEYIREWWANDALPLLYGARDEQWDIDIPLSLAEILSWRDNPADRPLNFSPIFDAFEIYRKHKDTVYESTGLREFERNLLT